MSAATPRSSIVDRLNEEVWGVARSVTTRSSATNPAEQSNSIASAKAIQFVSYQT
jgi:hypothetical protein